MRRLTLGVFYTTGSIIFIAIFFTLYHKEFMIRTEPYLSKNMIPLFNPHMQSFECAYEAQQLPPVDAQAEAWFLNAQSLYSPEIFFRDRDYQRITQLLARAANRHHWKAILNLASLYLDDNNSQRDEKYAKTLIESGIKLGIPTAYDRMGTYYSTGTYVKADPTRAYALWQKAAKMGSPSAQAFIGEKLNASHDSTDGTFWANRKVSLQMLICAIAQGNSDAAYNLSFRYALQPDRAATREEKQYALLATHHGVRLGCEKCANKLFLQFSNPFDLDEMIVPFIDEARAKRYFTLGKALEFDHFLRFPNLDKVVPLPPAPLPPWNGDRDTLVNAAMGVTPVHFFDESILPGKSRFDVQPPFALHNTHQTTDAKQAPKEGYWRPLGPDQQPVIDESGKPVRPGLYKQNETFTSFFLPHSKPAKPIENIRWEYWITTWGDREAVEPRAPKDLIRVVPRPTPFVSSASDQPCPRTGTWQPWVPADHPLAQLINQHWRQAWVVAGQPFPQPKTDWWLDLPDLKITWHLMDDTPVNINQPLPPSRDSQ
ncbi:tetratricopeptide repeat protein [Duganella callida]|uniref:Sel1 repeat family protein n=1 Tax=Duganella callida TaxID=2561932 RepID=A0A4Y9SXV4_9BURK|nr:tetratricopeptide repeat protein [Duganella callida]TFW30377.1 sel1 repeat family protein [Duganella callida]